MTVTGCKLDHKPVSGRQPKGGNIMSLKPPPALYPDPGLVAAITTRRLRKCIAEDAHISPGTCPRCGLTEGTL